MRLPGHVRCTPAAHSSATAKQPWMDDGTVATFGGVQVGFPVSNAGIVPVLAGMG